MNASVLDVALSLCCELLAQVRGVLILDVLDDGIPAAVVVDEIAIARGVDNVESQSHAVLLDDMGDSLNLGGAADRLIGLQSSLRIDQV